MTAVAVIQARMGSTRLPGKVLADLGGLPILGHVVARARRIPGVDAVVVATTTEAADDALAEACRLAGWRCFRGSEPDVLDRYLGAAVATGAGHIMRLTADNPFVGVEEAGRVLAVHRAGGDYTHNLTSHGGGVPVGTAVEVFTAAALERAWREGTEPHHREHVDEYLLEHPERFRTTVVTALDTSGADLVLTVDTPADLERARAIVARLEDPVAAPLAAVIAAARSVDA